MSNLHEECGVFGIFLRDGKKGVVQPTYHALYACSTAGRKAAASP